MGMYTELILGIEFSNDTPEYITEAFDYLINKHDDAEISEEARNFIDEYHVSMMLFGCSYYFAVTNPNYAFYRDGYDKKWHLSSRANLKNGGRIEKFLNFIKDYVTDGSGPRHLFAYVQYEESEFPTLWFPDGKCEYNPEDFERFYDDQVNKYYQTFNTIYNEICPDFVVTGDILKENGLQPDTYNYHDVMRIGVAEIVRRLKQPYDDRLTETMALNAKLIRAQTDWDYEKIELEYEIKALQSEIENLKKEREA